MSGTPIVRDSQIQGADSRPGRSGLKCGAEEKLQKTQAVMSKIRGEKGLAIR